MLDSRANCARKMRIRVFSHLDLKEWAQKTSLENFSACPIRLIQGWSGQCLLSLQAI